MSPDGDRLRYGLGETPHPSAWLVAPTICLLLGQALAAGPWDIPRQSAAVILLPLLLAVAPRWRLRATLIALALLAMAAGYARHRQLLFPEFAPNHLRSVMAREDGRIYLEGSLRHEPEKLADRTRWQIAAERI